MDAQAYKYSLRRRAESAAQRIPGASYRYHWYDLDFSTFLSSGVIARRSPDGRAYFNFPQTVWLFPGVEMDWSTRLNRPVQTLTVNILIPYIRKYGLRIFRDHENVKRHALNLSRPFAETFVLTMPETGGRIPREVIVDWLKDSVLTRSRATV